MDAVHESLCKWAAKASHILGSDMDGIMTAFLDPKSNGEHLRIPKQLFLTCHLTSESTLVLIANYRLWDAEILVRSIVEGTLKLIYLCNCDDGQRTERIKEYWIDLPRINDIKRHDRITMLLSLIKDSESTEWEPYRDLLLPRDIYEQLRCEYPKKLRKAIEHCWSFSEIMSTLSKTSQELEPIIGLAFGYGLGSHLTHQDGDAVGLVWDRTHRSTERKTSIDLAHGARLISDILTYSALRSAVITKIFDTDDQYIIQIRNQNESFFRELKIANEEWWRIEAAYQQRMETNDR